MTGNPLLLVIVAAVMFAILGGVTLLSHMDLFLSTRSVACIRLCESSFLSEGTEYAVFICHSTFVFFDRKNGKNPDKIGVF